MSTVTTSTMSDASMDILTVTLNMGKKRERWRDVYEERKEFEREKRMEFEREIIKDSTN